MASDKELRGSIYAGLTDRPHECEKKHKEKYPELSDWSVREFEDEETARAWGKDLRDEGYDGADDPGKGWKWGYTFTKK